MAVLVKNMFRIQKDQTLDQQLGIYTKYIQGDIDSLWSLFDNFGIGVLQKTHCFEFIMEVKKCMDNQFSENYQDADFERHFEKFDSKKTGVIVQADMGSFIK